MKITPFMVISGVRYVEKKPLQEYDICRQCAFEAMLHSCYAACSGLAQAAFGGDCEERDVVYERATETPRKRGNK